MIPDPRGARGLIRGHVISGVHLIQDANSLIGLIAVALVVAYGLRPGSRAMPPCPAG